MDVRVEEYPRFAPKKLSITIENEEELAMLWLRLNCSVSEVMDSNNIQYHGEADTKKLRKADDMGLALFDAIENLIHYPEPVIWCEDVLLKRRD